MIKTRTRYRLARKILNAKESKARKRKDKSLVRWSLMKVFNEGAHGNELKALRLGTDEMALMSIFGNGQSEEFQLSQLDRVVNPEIRNLHFQSQSDKATA